MDQRSHRGTDLFVRLIGDRTFYGSIESAQESISYYEKLAADVGTPRADRVAIELALIRIKRLRLIIDIDEAFEQLDRIAGGLVGSLEKLEFRLVKADLALFKTANYLDAKQEFESIALALDKTDHHLPYGLAAISLSIVNMMLGDLTKAEEYCQDSLSIFRRAEYELQCAYILNNYAVIKKKLCQYSESEGLLKQALRILRRINIVEGEIHAYNNLGVLKMKQGNLREAEYYLRKAQSTQRTNAMYERSDFRLSRNYDVNLLHIYVIQRKPQRAIELASEIEANIGRYSKRQTTLHQEFLAEMYMEDGNVGRAQECLGNARQTIIEIAPESDVMTEIMRRQAQLYLSTGELDDARREARGCVRLCKKIGDKHEMGAALRILGQVYVLEGLDKKAGATFEVGISTLKGINECYELMRTCIAYSEFLISAESPDADIYLLEAKQLCKKLEIDFFMSKIMLLSSKYSQNAGDFMLARSHLKTAEEICENLDDCDRKQLMPEIKRFYKDLEKSILQSSMKSAEKLKSLGKIYEDARFPIEELKPEMALEVAKNVGAESLFLAKKKNKGFYIPLKYNIADSAAKQILKRRREDGIRGIFTVKDPMICPLGTGKTLVSVPSQRGSGYVLCTVIDQDRDFTPRELEFLFASVEAMERVADEYTQTPGSIDLGDFMEESGGRLRHPGGSFKHIITLDSEMIKIIHLAERASQTNVPVLLEGETGVGKELFAQAIHLHSPRKHRQFVAINAGGVPLNLLESQLFGHVKGAFTDAVGDRVGLIEEAQGGGLFFDEVGEMSEELQIKLLRLLESGEFRRLGENRVRTADVRVISATNKDLQELVSEGKFREDLYYRLATVKFKIPPLRDRKRDIEFLVRHFLSDGLSVIGRPPRRINIDMKTLEAFEFYYWPGNIRELRNEIMRILSLIGNGELIRFGMLSDRVKDAFKKRDEGGVLTAHVERFERRLILKALEENDWNRIRTAEQIGIPRTTLLFKMKRLDIIT